MAREQYLALFGLPTHTHQLNEQQRQQRSRSTIKLFSLLWQKKPATYWESASLRYLPLFLCASRWRWHHGCFMQRRYDDQLHLSAVETKYLIPKASRVELSRYRAVKKGYYIMPLSLWRKTLVTEAFPESVWLVRMFVLNPYIISWYSKLWNQYRMLRLHGIMTIYRSGVSDTVC